MILAVTLDPAVAGLIGLAITTVGSIIINMIQKREHNATQAELVQERTALTTVIKGVEEGVRKVAAGEAPVDAVKDEIKDVALDAGVQTYLHTRVQEITNPKASSSNGTAAP